MNDTFNKSLIAGHEGLRLVAYRDSTRSTRYPLGILTVGRGFNLEANGAALVCQCAGVLYAAVRLFHPLTMAQADAIFAQQYAAVAVQARATFPKLDTYPDAAAAVICDMISEIGLEGFLGFHDTISAFRAQDWRGVIAGILHSELESEVPGRVKNNISLLEALPVAA